MVNVGQTTTTDLDNAGLDYSTPGASLNEPSTVITYWNNDYWDEGYALWEDNPSYKEPIRALARWTVGKGYETDNNRTKIELDNIVGWGEDSFQSILTNLIIVKKTNGDAYAEIIKENGRLLNLKVLNPRNVKTGVNPKGMIEHYKIKQSGDKYITKKPSEILHLCNDRVANQIHGTPAWKAAKWELEAKKEVLKNTRRVLQRGAMRVIYVDFDNNTNLSTVKTEWATAIKYGEALILPGKKGQDVEVVDYNIPDIGPFMRFLEYLDSRIYQALGIGKVIADPSGFTEAGSKVGYLTFEPTYAEEQTLLEQDLWNQLAIKLKFNRPPSLAGTLQQDEQKNTGQLGFQPNETTAQITRTE